MRAEYAPRSQSRRPVMITFGLLLALLAALQCGVEAQEKPTIAELVAEPYRGAVLRVSPVPSDMEVEGAVWSARFYQDGLLEHESELVPDGSGFMVAEIIDLMFLVGVPLEVELVEESSGDTRHLRLDFEQYFPWIDWVLADDQEFEILDTFRYCWPDCDNGMGAHSSWDIATSGRCPVYSGTHGQVIDKANSGSLHYVFVYNPEIGAILEYGHVRPSVAVGQTVGPDDLIGFVDTAEDLPHIHFSVMRPAWINKHSRLRWSLRQFQRTLFGLPYYRDPFYYHEPATWGYWNTDTLPNGAHELMLSYFDRHNPGVGPGTEDALVCDRSDE